jgi:glutaredoxin
MPVASRITVYTNVGGGPCHKAVEFLSHKGVEFTEKNVGRDPEARKELIALGLLSLPVLLIGEQKLTGFNPNAIEAALAALT